jgi:hypothetical protein
MLAREKLAGDLGRSRRRLNLKNRRLNLKNVESVDSRAGRASIAGLRIAWNTCTGLESSLSFRH